MNLSKNVSLLLLCALFLQTANTQNFERTTFPLKKSGQTLKFPFAGGLNNPQFSNADLNNDGVQDLLVFDRSGDVVLTFLNGGTANQIDYTFAPQYIKNFPILNDWALMRDYNKDGIADIFCASHEPGTQEVQVYRGYYDNNALKFTPFQFTYPNCSLCDRRYIYYPDEDMPGFYNNLPIATTDLPSVDDIDGDGDLDILTFEASVGGHIWWVQNLSQELGFGNDSLKFRVADKCWGDFYESGLVACKNSLSPSTDECSNGLMGTLEEEKNIQNLEAIAQNGENQATKPRHPGSTVMTYDQEADGDKEVVLGDISFSCLNMMTNGGTPLNAWMTAQDTFFPIYDTPVNLPIFPAAYYMDFDNDGARDMVAAPNSVNVSEDVKCSWLYKNTGSNSNHQFTLQRKNFMVGEMADMGSVSHPTFVDVNADNLLDIVVGNSGYFLPGVANNASLYLYLNTGTATAPAFTLQNEDWLGMSEFAPNDFDFHPAFGDLDGDGDLDLIVGGNGGWHYFYVNSAGANTPMQFTRDNNLMWFTLDVGISSAPFIVDLDEDGLKDLVIGERNGNVNFFKNTGSPTEPTFATLPTIDKLGAIDTRDFGSVVGFSTPVMLCSNNQKIIVAGTLEGKLEAYKFGGVTNDVYENLSMNLGNTDEGRRSSPAFADLDNDGFYEMLTGNQRGGLGVFKTGMSCTMVSTEPEPAKLAARIQPNPVEDVLQVHLENAMSVNYRVLDLLGRVQNVGFSQSSSFYIDVSAWESGFYVLELVGFGDEKRVFRFLKL